MITSIGAAQVGGQLGEVTPKEKARAELEIKLMRGELAKWLKYRTLLGTPPTDILPVERRLGQRLFVLLSEMFDAQTLPSAASPIALAQIAISGKLPTETVSPSAQGIVWLWPAVAVVGLVLVTVIMKVRSDAADAADARRVQCIEAGKCTDTGFWLKLGGVMLVAWLAWDKFGLREAVERRTKHS
jgi:hypothetical protein